MVLVLDLLEEGAPIKYSIQQYIVHLVFLLSLICFGHSILQKHTGILHGSNYWHCAFLVVVQVEYSIGLFRYYKARLSL